MARLKDYYVKEVVPLLKTEFGYKNVHQIPKLVKVVLNMGLGEAVQDIKIIDKAAEELTLISGQKPIVRKARKSIAAFKLREGMPVGCTVTLRGERMYEFLDRLINAVLPRVRDFRGVSAKGFDGRGNYTMGLADQSVFPEINYDAIDKLRGMNITIVTTAASDDEGRSLLAAFGMPFRK
ncbi:MAG TPA: 50S ribosomal protein L5 [Deltaproteobacteria bacterium]|jgi:large subunit ribosomal protein L5|nr:50S ribosomal protein L5 [Deltaproteobacteria bacterium]OQC28988.1 MAG: 50S ribosomal protein L5 [Deltaproteobacteria bacterium ADurb.Bin072]HRW80857.1 50S ribosomal protein L5 [Desulfomonilia bacterium]HNQ86410.1 50S ribosomal protein L5 [Deltaproteobacteria bacterium]HNS90625.1 50S ribosomal protein L5 [Deltaproteobacteria bacterium]